MAETKTKTKGQELSEKLTYETKVGWEKLNKKENDEVFNFCNKYINFLNVSKTERETVKESIRIAQESGFVDLQEIKSKKTKLKAGDKVYYSNRGKTLMLAVIGKDAFENGINAVGAHIDSPRIDLKPNPVYESEGLCLFKTHYYGGIKKYQWTVIPLALHGVIVKKDGQKVDISIGEQAGDPVFCITDLLPHLGKEQMDKKMEEAIPGENLNIIIGSVPYDDEKVKDKVKLNILNILNQKYNITEKDFASAELEIVPAFKAASVGFDSGLVGGYGQDDRVCAYTSLIGILEISSPKKTAVCILADKEEVGSMGNTGMQSRAFENFLLELMEAKGESSFVGFNRCLANSKMLSADVNAAMDPTYESVMEKRNAAYIGRGVVISKYTGSRGKSNSSEASAEFVNEVIKIFEDNGVLWQMGELGKVDQGGGGTIAQYLANLGLDVVDCGVGILSMHAPYELSSKLDVYMAYKCYKAFMNK